MPMSPVPIAAQPKSFLVSKAFYRTLKCSRHVQIGDFEQCGVFSGAMSLTFRSPAGLLPNMSQNSQGQPVYEQCLCRDM